MYINQLPYFLFALVIAGCTSTPAPYDPDKDPAEIEATRKLFSEEASRIEPVKEYVQRQGRQLYIHSDNGKVQTFINSFDRRCGEFDCDWFSYKGLYAANQFFQIGSLSGEFYTPDYLVSRKSGLVTDLIGAVSIENLSLDVKYIANAVGGDAGPDAGIYIWQVKAGELQQVYEYAPKGKYANYRVRGWIDNNTVHIDDEAGYDDSCKTANNSFGWSKSQLTLTASSQGWLLKKTSVECLK